MTSPKKKPRKARSASVKPLKMATVPLAKKPAAARRARKPENMPPRERRYGHAAAIIDKQTLAAAIDALRVIDPEIVALLLEIGGFPPLRLRKPGFAGLVSIIVGQQVSTASAQAINGRLDAAFPDMNGKEILAASDDILRACGLSAPKRRTLRALALAVGQGAVNLETLGDKSAEEAHATLCALHGIGPWTADIFLLFCLGHADAWPAGDLALQEAAKLALSLSERPNAKALDAIGERWRPYRGVAARLLWAYYRVAKEGKSGMMLE